MSKGHHQNRSRDESGLGLGGKVECDRAAKSGLKSHPARTIGGRLVRKDN
jgi:hypothetical protein